MPTGSPMFCVNPGEPIGLVFEYEPDFDLTAFSEALFTAKRYMDDDPDDGSAVIAANGVIDPPTGTVTVQLSASDTEALHPGRFYWFDLTLVTPGGTAAQVSVGRFSAAPAVTNRRTAA